MRRKASHTTDIHFFSGKQFKGEENVDAKARQVIGKLLTLFELVDTLGIDCQNALGVNNGDYEDAILIESAARAGIDCIVTRNPARYKESPIQMYAPDEFVSVISQQQ